jgi:hypothetical protein
MSAYAELANLREANARLVILIAEMLVALKTAERLLLDGVAREKVRAAIAKAEGWPRWQ